jgi:hypothetical protein
MQGVRMDTDELIDAYGVSRRLAVRIGALLAKGIEVSPTLVEIAGAGSPMEKLLLHRDLLEHAESLSPESLKKLAAETGAEADGPLALVATPEARVIALEEELLAQEAQAKNGRPDTALVRPETAGEPTRYLDEKERRDLFNREEIARLKLEVLAGRDAEARISALRKLIFAPISAQEKGGICLRALMDRSSEVRSEAIKALESLGFDRDTADAVRRVLEGDERARHGALRRLGDLLDRLQAGEQRIVLAVLVEVFRESKLKGEHDPLLHLLEEIIPLLSVHTEIVPELARVAVQQMLAEPGRLGGVMRDFLGDLAKVAPEVVAAKLWEECGTVRDPAPRAILLGLLIELEKDPAGRARLCDVVARDLMREDMDEMSRQKLGHNMTVLGEAAAEALLKRYAAASNTERAMLTSFLDILGVDRDIPDDLRNRIAAQLTAALPAADRPLRQEILRSRVFRLPVIEESLKRKLAEELISLLKSDISGPEVADRAALLLETLGESAAGALLDYLKGSPAERGADTAARVLGRVLSAPEASPEAARVREAAVRFLLERMKQQREAPGGYAVALAQLVSAGRMESEMKGTLGVMLDRFAQYRHLGDVIEAISRLASEASVDAAQRVEAAHVLGEILNRPSGGEETRMRELTSGGVKLFEITGRIEFDSEILPAAVRGMRQIALAPATTEGPRDRIVEQFIRVWKQVASWEVVWGPRSSQTLAEALGDVAADEKTKDPVRVQIISELMVATERVSVVRALTRVFAHPTKDGQVNEFIVDAATGILNRWVQPEIAPEELEEVLAAAVEAAARPTLNSRRATTKKLRERVARLLFDAMRAGHAWHRPLLEKLGGCRSMPRRMRSRIEEAIAQTAIVRATL